MHTSDIVQVPPRQKKRIAMPRKKRSRNNGDDRQPDDDGRRRLPKRIPDSAGVRDGIIVIEPFNNCFIC